MLDSNVWKGLEPKFRFTRAYESEFWIIKLALLMVKKGISFLLLRLGRDLLSDRIIHLFNSSTTHHPRQHESSSHLTIAVHQNLNPLSTSLAGNKLLRTELQPQWEMNPPTTRCLSIVTYEIHPHPRLIPLVRSRKPSGNTSPKFE